MSYLAQEFDRLNEQIRTEQASAKTSWVEFDSRFAEAEEGLVMSLLTEDWKGSREESSESESMEFETVTGTSASTRLAESFGRGPRRFTASWMGEF